MIPFGPKLKLIAGTALIAGIAYSGWMARGWFEDSKDLAAQKAQEALAAAIREEMSGISRQVENRLGELRANERVIDRGVIREIHKPIYQRVCLEPDAVRLLNAAAKGDAPREPDGEVSPGTSSAD